MPKIRIVCQEDQSEELLLSETETMTLVKDSDYFKAMFAYGMAETETWTIQKPTWSKATAKHIVTLICNAKTKVENLSAIKDVLSACDEILIDAKIHGKKGSELLACFNEEPLCTAQFTIDVSQYHPSLPIVLEDDNYLIDMVYNAAANNFFFIPLDGLVITFEKEKKTSPEKAVVHGNIDDFIRELAVHIALNPPDCLLAKELVVHHPAKLSAAEAANTSWKLFRDIRSSSDDKVFQHEEMSVRFNIPFSYVRAIDKLVLSVTSAVPDLKGYVTHGRRGSKPGYFLKPNIVNVWPTLTGTPASLFEVLKLLDDKMNATKMGVVSVRVTAPSETTLTNLMIATHSCASNPGTIGINVVTNAYYAVKTWDDMTKLLLALHNLQNEVRGDGKKTVPGPVRFVALYHSSSQEVF